MLYKGMVSKSKYWISEKIRVMSTQKRRKNPYARVLVLCQVPLETIMRVVNESSGPALYCRQTQEHYFFILGY